MAGRSLAGRRRLRHRAEPAVHFEHPARLGEMGATLEQCLSVLDGVMRDHCGATNPRPMTREEAEALLRAAW
jgi:alcohol dehydrogenase class IV